jgi:hypothetical protein
MKRETKTAKSVIIENNNPAGTEILGDLSGALDRQGKLAEAETDARQNLAIREKTAPEDWLAFDARCRLGAILLDRKNIAEAEPLLLSGYNGMKERESAIPVPAKPPGSTTRQIPSSTSTRPLASPPRRPGGKNSNYVLNRHPKPKQKQAYERRRSRRNHLL